MFSAFMKGISQLSDPKTRRVVWIGMGLALTAFIGLWFMVAFALTHTVLFSILWLDTAADILGGLATLVLTWLLFPAVVSAVIGFFLEDIAGAVEARHFPNLPEPRAVPILEILATTAKFLGVMVLVNFMLLFFLVIPPIFPFVFYSANGYLLSREYFELVALRRIGPEEARVLRKANSGRLFITGVIVAFLLTVPVVNLLAPIVATAVMVHLFEGWRRGE
ncbi:MAG: EI24 domain-containing protein [Rhodospirillales bacterium]|nr:EI24 domain-containing protein [Rhodospirillales bacterium]